MASFATLIQLVWCVWEKVLDVMNEHTPLYLPQPVLSQGQQWVQQDIAARVNPPKSYPVACGTGPGAAEFETSLG